MDTTTLGAALALAKSIPGTAVSEAQAVLEEAQTVAESIPEEYTELSGDVAELKSAVANSVALSVVWTDGWKIISTGSAVHDDTQSYATAYVVPGEKIHGLTRAGIDPMRAIAFFDKNDAFISSDYNPSGTSYTWNYQFTVPANAYRIKITCGTSYKSTFTLFVDNISDVAINQFGAERENIDSLNLKTAQNEESIGDVCDAISYAFDYQYLFTRDKINNYYWALNDYDGSPYMLSLENIHCWAPIQLKAGKYYTNVATSYTYIQKQSDETDIVKLGDMSPGSDGSYTIAYDSILYASLSNSSGIGYWATAPVSAPVPEGRFNKRDGLTELFDGITTQYSGSYYQKRYGDFKQGTYWRIKFVSTTAAAGTTLEVLALTDAEDNTTQESQFILKVGQERLWSPLKNYEAIRYGVNGSCVVEINNCGSMYDKLERKILYCGPNRQYTKLIDAIAAAEEYMGSVLYVDAGTYDLVSEFGADYFAGITSNDSMPGVVLKNRIHIIFSSNSRVVCHYEGNNQYVLQNFSPFNLGQYGFTIENLNLDSSRTRYAIHDERNGRTEQCLSKYINCNIKHDNSGNEQWSSYCCIGGGLGSNHEVYIENCIFESIARSGVVVHCPVSYHPSNQASNTDFACKLTIKDNYFVVGTVELTGRSDAVNDTYVIFTNNSVSRDPAAASNGLYFGGSSSFQGTHYVIKAWNNEIRQS